MSALAVAEKDFRDAIQSRALWALLVGFVLLSSLLSYSYVELFATSSAMQPGQTGQTSGATVEGLMFFIASAAGLFIPITAIVVSYKAIAGERELGSMKLLLALPHTRSDVLFGKLLGRSGVVSAALAVGLLFAFGIGFALLGTFEALPVLLFVLVTVLFTVIYVGIAVSLSATTGSSSRATTMALGYFLLFELGWNPATAVVVFVANRLGLAGPDPAWSSLLMQIPPSAAYTSALVAVLPGTEGVMNQVMANSGSGAFYEASEFGFVVLALWLVVPLAIGYYRFENADL